MLAQARPLWLELPEGTLRIQLLTDLARLGGLPGPELAALWQAQGTAGRSRGGAEGARSDGDGEGASGGSPRRRLFRTGGVANPSSMPSGRRQAPKRPEDRVVQMLFGQPSWWHNLTPAEQDLLHQLPAPHGPAIAWLERDLAEHGTRPWAALREALAHDEDLPPDSRALANGDGDPDRSEDDLRSAVGMLLLEFLNHRLDQLAKQAGTPAGDMRAYRALTDERNALKERLKTLTQRVGAE